MLPKLLVLSHFFFQESVSKLAPSPSPRIKFSSTVVKVVVSAEVIYFPREQTVLNSCSSFIFWLAEHNQNILALLQIINQCPQMFFYCSVNW